MAVQPQPVNDTTLAEAARRLRAGGLVALPTETVYGLGADALDVDAVARVFATKQRPRFDPLIMHVASAEAAREHAASWPEAATRLAEALWPGPLTLVLPKREHVPDLITAGLDTVALRVPGHDVAKRLIELAGCPVAAPSANRFGGISPTRAEHVAAELGEALDKHRDMILDAGACEQGVESTVVSLIEAGRAMLLRPGATTTEVIEQIIGKVTMAGWEGDKQDAGQQGLRSPGMSARHYAPRTSLRLVANIKEATAMMDVMVGEKPSNRLGLLTMAEAIEHPAIRVTERLSPRGDLHEAAANLFAAMRRLDGRGLDVIIAIRVPEAGLGRAINDRLSRAAAR